MPISSPPPTAALDRPGILHHVCVLVLMGLIAACSDAPELPTDVGSAPPIAAAAAISATDASSTTGIPMTVVPDVTAAQATAITNDGWIFGSGQSPHFPSPAGRAMAFVWRGSGNPEALDTQDRISAVRDANESGQAVGYYVNPNTLFKEPFLWTPEVGMETVPLPGNFETGGVEPEAWGITESGDVTGRYSVGAPDWSSFFKPHDATTSFDMAVGAMENISVYDAGEDLVVGTGGGAFQWSQAGGYTFMNATRTHATATNGSTVVGRVFPEGSADPQAAILSPDAPPVFLGTLGGAMSEPAGINSQGWVVGRSTTAESALPHAFVWTPEDGMQDLGTLGLADVSASTALDINDEGIIAGASDGHAVIWHFQPGNTEDEPPTIGPIISPTVTVGELLEITPVVSDPEDDAWSLEWSGDIPHTAVVNGIFSWTPTADQIGSHTITVTARQDSDPSLFDEVTFVISVIAAGTVPTADTHVTLAPAVAGQYFLGDTVPYVATIHNAGPDPVAVAMTVELEFRDQAEWGNIPEGDVVNGVFPAKPREVGPNASVDIPFEVIYGAFGTQSLKATLTGDYTEIDPSNDSAVYDQAIDLLLTTPGVETGRLTLDGQFTADGLPLALVGVQIPGALIAGHGPDLFIASDLTPTNAVLDDQLIPADQISPADQFVPGNQFVPRDHFVPGGRYIPEGPFAPGDKLVLGDQFVAGDIRIPGIGDWNPRGRLLFADGEGTDLLVSERSVGSPELLLQDLAAGGLSVAGVGGATEAGVELCNGTFQGMFDGGDAAGLTCGSLRIEATTGRITFELLDGTIVEVPAGAIVDVTEGVAGAWDVELIEGGPLTVLRPATFETLRADLDELLADGILNGGLHRALSRKIEQAKFFLDGGKKAEAIAVLEDFSQQVIDLTDEGVLSIDQADALRAAAAWLLADLMS